MGFFSNILKNKKHIKGIISEIQNFVLNNEIYCTVGELKKKNLKN